MQAISHKTNGWGRVEYKIINATNEAKKPCYEIRYADDNSLKAYSVSYNEASKYICGTLQGVVTS